MAAATSGSGITVTLVVEDFFACLTSTLICGVTFSKLKQAIDCLDGAISESSFQEGDNAASMLLNALG